MAKSREDAAKSPLGELLAKHRGRMSVRRAAQLAEVSEGRWRQIEAGYELKGGQQFPVNPRPETVATMARAVGADVVEALHRAGYHPDEYSWLHETEPPAGDRSIFDEMRGDVRSMTQMLQDLAEKIEEEEERRRQA